MTLIDKLKVHIGDIITLKNNERVSVVGYVNDYTPRSVTLSHQDPKAVEESMPFPTRGLKVFPGDRKYNLKNFDSYEIFKPKQG